MSNLAIRIERLYKEYQLGATQSFYQLVPQWLRGESSLEADRRRFTALADINLDAKAGEVIGIIGSNGAGKSTLLKILSRITQPTRGRFMLYGRVGSLLEVGTGFHNELTGRENVYMNGMILGMRRDEIDRKFDEIVAFAGVEQFIDTPVKRYSSGMGVRLAFAVAAHLEPEILLIDEVLAVGDLSFQHKSIGKMQDVAGQGRTVLFVSHNMQAISRLCTRTILLDHGQIVADGDTNEVIERYIDLTHEISTGRVEWDSYQAPGERGVKLRSVELLDNQGNITVIADVDDDLYLRIGYHIEQPGLSVRCVARLHADGVCAFVSIEPHEHEHRTTGIYYSTLHIPANLLADIDYSVHITLLSSGGVKKMKYVSQRDVISFTVVDHLTGNTARGDYAERLIGVIRPKLDWTLEADADST